MSQYQWRVGDVFMNGKFRWKVDSIQGDRAVLRSCDSSWATTRLLTFEEWNENGRWKLETAGNNPWDAYDRQREAFEQQPVMKAGGYESRRLSEKTKSVPPKPPPLDAELSQASTVPPERPSTSLDQEPKMAEQVKR